MTNNSTHTNIPAQWIRSAIRNLSAYHVPDAAGLIKLDAMENPYHWPTAMREQWLSVLRDVEMNRYPDPGASLLKQSLRDAMSVPSSSDIILGNGSDELIQMILMALAAPDRVVLAPTPSFVMYQMIAAFVDMRFVGVPLAADFSLPRAAMLTAIQQQQPAVIFLAYPNNPSGNLWDVDTLHAIIQAAPGVVVLDEAYHAFAARSFMDQLPRYDNLLVMRTLSKMGLAGLRLGLLAGAPAWMNEFDKIRLPYNINVLTQATARFAMQHIAVLNEQTQRICQDRTVLYTALQSMQALEVFPSQANFILFRAPVGQAQGIFDDLKLNKVLIKNLSGAGGLLRDCLRVTVGSAQENDAFLTALRRLL
jgi:histidinol-phosphate aminotransferase